MPETYSSSVPPSGFVPVLDQMVTYPDRLKSAREVVLANAVMTGEIPAPTFEEENRARFLSDRFTEEDLQGVSIDEAGNVTAVLPGKVGENNILVVAHIDTVFEGSVDHTVTVAQEELRGPGIADNSLGVAAMISLPSMLGLLELELDDNLILVGVTKGIGRGNLEGLRFFLDNFKEPIRAGICVEGVHLGRLSYTCLGMLRGEITCTAPEESDWLRFSGTGAIIPLNRIISQILAIPTPQSPFTSIVLGSVAAGTTYNTPSMRAGLRFEVRSVEEEMIRRVQRRLEDIVDETTLTSSSRAEMKIISRRKPGGIPFEHPLVRSTRTIMDRLDIEPKIEPSSSELSEMIAHNIPAVTLGISRGENVHEFGESVKIDPVYRGVAQVIGLLQAIDGGFTDDNG